MTQTLLTVATSYRLVALRLALVFLLATVPAFLSETEDYSDQAWAELGTFRRVRIFLKSFGPGLAAVYALFDTSFSKARAAHAQAKAAQDLQTIKPEDAP
jgi:hypothetical protein